MKTQQKKTFFIDFIDFIDLYIYVFSNKKLKFILFLVNWVKNNNSTKFNKINKIQNNMTTKI